MDTNVILSRYIRSDPYREAAKKIFSFEDVERYSYVTLIELFSVVSRLLEEGAFRIPQAIQREIRHFKYDEKVQFLVAYFVKESCIRIPFTYYDYEALLLPPCEAVTPSLFVEICMLSSKLRLKTLDNLQIALALILRRTMADLDYFMTEGKQILNKRFKIEGSTGMNVVSPTELLDLMV